MATAIEAAAQSRLISPPNPWVGSVVVTNDGTRHTGSTRRPGGNHAEREALQRAGASSRGATLYSTLEPCSHQGRTGPCTDAIIEAGIGTVVYGVDDPDPHVAGSGRAQLEAAGITVVRGVCEAEIEAQLAPYLHHRRTGRPYVVLKLASTLDGRTAAADGTSQWITGPEARADAHLVRAQSDAILVGAGTVRADNPRLTVRDIVAGDGQPLREPLRVVLGSVPDAAAVHPCLEMKGSLDEVLDDLGARDVVQLMVEGGAAVAGAFHRAGLVDHYVLYLAPALMGGDDGHPVFAEAGASSIAELTRGRMETVARLGDDLRIDFKRA
ncbi:MAG: diaminohydroxyphosphoribosylaminopyrimidine deaminase [Acidimicrobiales bacterium]|jgi:diaminohydroxyphosphoribosylaminopyrimidine deaminase / 5-amino-6-(5-phosphoribosylamino)uracil reductase